MKDHAADELDVEGTLAEGPLGGLPDGGEGRNQDIVEGLAGGKLGLERLGAGAQLVIRELREFRLQRVDRLHLGLKGLQPALIDRAKDFLRERTEHRKPSDYQELRRGGLGPPYRPNHEGAHLKDCAPGGAALYGPRPSPGNPIASDPVT